MAHVRKSSKISKQVLVSWNDVVDDYCQYRDGMHKGKECGRKLVRSGASTLYAAVSVLTNGSENRPAAHAPTPLFETAKRCHHSYIHTRQALIQFLIENLSSI
jgi:hypothetical protein